MHLIVAAPFDDPTKTILSGAFDRVVAVFAEENVGYETNTGLLETVARAIIDLASAGQRESGQLERYAESRGRQFLRELVVPAR